MEQKDILWGMLSLMVGGAITYVFSQISRLFDARGQAEAAEVQARSAFISTLIGEVSELRRMVRECEERDRLKGNRIAELERTVQGLVMRMEE